MLPLVADPAVAENRHRAPHPSLAGGSPLARSLRAHGRCRAAQAAAAGAGAMSGDRSLVVRPRACSASAQRRRSRESHAATAAPRRPTRHQQPVVGRARTAAGAAAPRDAGRAARRQNWHHGAASRSATPKRPAATIHARPAAYTLLARRATLTHRSPRPGSWRRWRRRRPLAALRSRQRS